MSKKSGKEHVEDIKRWKREIEQEEAFGGGSRLSAELRQVMNMTDEELKASMEEDEWKLSQLRKREQEKQQKQKAQQDALRQQQELERLAVLAGLEKGAAKQAEKKVQQMADRQLKKVLGK